MHLEGKKCSKCKAKMTPMANENKIRTQFQINKMTELNCDSVQVDERKQRQMAKVQNN